MNHYKTLATILFRVFGVSNVVYAPLYWLYGTFMNLFETPSRFLVTALWASTYLLLGVLLIALSSRLGRLVVTGLEQPMVPPPPPSVANNR